MTHPIRYGNKCLRAHLKGEKTFTETGTWTVPTGVRYINLYLVGSGGNGGNGVNYEYNDKRQSRSGGGGGGGRVVKVLNIRVHRGDIVSVTVGSGNTTVVVNGTTYTAAKGGDAGSGSVSGYVGSGGTGGSGGGGGNSSSKGASPQYCSRTAGGRNGGDGDTGWAAPPGWDMNKLNNGGTGLDDNTTFNNVTFSTGGYGGAVRAQNPTTDEQCNPGAPNTGNGGDGANAGYTQSATTWYYGKAGGTGFALITWGWAA